MRALSMMGILGGTFDPIHYGHLRPAQEVLRTLSLSEIRFIPAANPPHRQPPVATPAQRLEMVQLAVTGISGFSVDDRELRRGGISYTVLTLQSLREELPQVPLCLLMGVDAFAKIETWHQWQTLFELAHVVVMTRPGWDIPGKNTLPAWTLGRIVNHSTQLTQTNAGHIYFQTVRPQDISASYVRAAIAKGDCVTDMLPPAVHEYIHANRIYSHRGN